MTNIRSLLNGSARLRSVKRTVSLRGPRVAGVGVSPPPGVSQEDRRINLWGRRSADPSHLTRTIAHSDLVFGLVAGVMLLACAIFPSRLTLADEKSVPVKGAAVAAPENPAKADRPATKKPAGIVSPVSPAREAAAVEFAQQNHPELVSLLQGLKKNAPKEYQAALTDLDRAADRLTKLKEKAPERYEFQLAEWKITSRIRLLAAKLAMSEDPAVETELRAALRERLEMRLTAQRTERDRLQKRVEKLDQTIGEMSSKTEATIEKQFAELKTTMPVPKTSAKNKVKRPVAAGSVGIKGGKE